MNQCDPPTHYYVDSKKVIYPPCRKCGNSHEISVTEMATGEITSIDFCYSCFWIGFKIDLTGHIKELNEIKANKDNREPSSIESNA
jgi:hypothetical protein